VYQHGTLQVLGKARVLRELKQRRVAPALAKESVDAAYSGSDEVEMIEAFLKRKFRTVKMAEYLAEEKHLASAYRKLRYSGFSSSNSIKVLKRYAERAEEFLADRPAEAQATAVARVSNRPIAAVPSNRAARTS
jgi:regulatory protein